MGWAGGGGGELLNGGRGASEVLPLRKKGGAAESVLAMPKGGHNKFWGNFYTVAGSFSHTDGGGGSFHHLETLRGA